MQLLHSRRLGCGAPLLRRCGGGGHAPLGFAALCRLLVVHGPRPSLHPAKHAATLTAAAWGTPLHMQIVHVLRQYPAGRLVVFAYILGVHLFIYILLHRCGQLDAATDCRGVWPVLRKHRGGSIDAHPKRAMRVRFPPSRPVGLVHLENPAHHLRPVTSPMHYSPCCPTLRRLQHKAFHAELAAEALHRDDRM